MASNKNSALWLVLLLSITQTLKTEGASGYVGTIEHKNIRLDANNEVNAVVFTVDFNSDIQLASGDEVPMQKTSLCWGSNDCVCMPPQMTAQLGLTTLICGSVVLHSVPRTFDDCNIDYGKSGPPDYLLPLPSAVDPFRSMLSLTGRLSSPVRYMNNRISVMVYTSFRDIATDFIQPRFQDIDFTQCRLNISSSFQYTDVDAQLPQEITVWRKPTYPCTYPDMNRVGYEMETAMSEIQIASDWVSLNKIRWKLPVLGESQAWLACYRSMETLIKTTTEKILINTADCVYPRTDPKWETDPCCNPMMRWEYCCASGFYEYEYKYFDQVIEGNANVCKTKEKPVELLLDLMDHLNAVDNPVSGCLAKRQQLVDDDVFQNASAVVDVCKQKIIGDSFGPPQCITDSECLTECYLGYCEIPWDNWDETFAKCYDKYMNPAIKRTIQYLWDLPTTRFDEIFQSYLIEKLSDVNCVGLTSSYLTFRDGRYIPVDEETCLSHKYCNWNPSLTESECLNNLGGRNFCGSCVGPLCPSVSRPQTCFTIQETSNPETCKQLGGYFDLTVNPFPCLFSNYTNVEECLPTTICPKYTNTTRVIKQCDKPVCYLKGVGYRRCRKLMQSFDCATLSSSKDYPKFWDRDLAGGNGLCTIILPSPDEDLCLASNGTWFGGRSWNYEIHSTPETCQGVCRFNDYVYLGLTKEECSKKEFCGISVPRCVSQSNINLCFSDLNACECLKSGGSFDKAITKCVHKLNETECVDSGYTYQSCESLSNEECQECALNPDSGKCSVIQSFLKCAIARNVSPPKEYCVAEDGGVCIDTILYNTNPKCGRYISFEYEDASNTNCFGSCVKDVSIDRKGRPFCDEKQGFRSSPLGCINFMVFTKSDCELLDDHVWLHQSISAEECTVTKGLGCDLYGSQTVLNPMDEKNCTLCGGEYKSKLLWRKSKWIEGGVIKPTTWLEPQFVSVNNYTTTFNFTKVELIAQKAAAMRYSGYFESENRCRYQTLIDNLRMLTCDCFDKTGGPSTCYPDTIRERIVGTQRFCHGIEDWIKTRPVEIKVRKYSVPIEFNCVDVILSLVSATQFKRKTKYDSLSSDQLSKITNAGSNHPYAIVKYKERTVGQIVGDGIQFSFTGDMNDVFVCIERRRDISRDSQFVIPSMVARLNDSSFVPFTVNVTSYNITICAYVSMSSVGGITLFPGFLEKNWMRSLDDTRRQIAVYFTMIVFTILSCYSFLKVCTAIIRKKPMVQRVIYLQIALFSMFRIVYLAIYLIEGIKDGSTTQFFLYDAPRMIFYSAYTTLVILWAELSSEAIVMNISSSIFKRSYYMSNAATYAIFFTILALDETLSEESAIVLRCIYYTYLAILSICIATGFVLYGRRIYKKLSASISSPPSDSRRQRALKVGIVALICSLAFFLQSAYVLFTLIYDIQDIWVALAPFLLFEAMPCLLVLYSLRTRIRWEVFTVIKNWILHCGSWDYISGDKVMPKDTQKPKTLL